MKILQIVTLHSPDNAFGGPLRVAVNCSLELTRRGHTVQILALGRGFEELPSMIEGVPASLLPARTIHRALGFSGIYSFGLFGWIIRRRRDFDLVHVHMARDLVTLPAARLAQILGIPTVIQTHGMVDASKKRLAQVVDVLATKDALRRASAVLYLTETERGDLLSLVPGLKRLQHLPNGVPKQAAKSEYDPDLVVYLARLQARKRPTALVLALPLMIASIPGLRLKMAGPDEGELSLVLEAVLRLGLENSFEYLGALSHREALVLLRRAAVYVLPSVDEPFPMTVLEALSVGTPVVVRDSCGLAPEVQRYGAGLVVVDDSTEALAEATQAILMERKKFSERALDLAREAFSIDVVVDRLVNIYRSAQGRRKTSTTSGSAAAGS